MSKYRKGIEAIIAESGQETKDVRRLVFHPESDCVFETHTDIEWEACMQNGCEDVTGIAHHEEVFKRQKEQELNEDEALVN